MTRQQLPDPNQISRFGGGSFEAAVVAAKEFAAAVEAETTVKAAVEIEELAVALGMEDLLLMAAVAAVGRAATTLNTVVSPVLHYFWSL
ncbi:unnamed protein product [Arabidopsis halleri]